MVIIAACTSAHKGFGPPSGEDGGPDTDADTGTDVDTGTGNDTDSDHDLLPGWSLNWARHYKATVSSYIYDTNRFGDLARCGSDAVVFTGWFSGQISFYQTHLLCFALSCMYLAKVDLDGAASWAIAVGAAPGSVVGRRLDAVEHSSGGCRIAVSGEYTHDTAFGLGEPAETWLQGKGVFHAVYEPDGTLAWVRAFAPTGLAVSRGIAFTGDGSVVATGMFGGQVVLGQGSPSETALEATGEPQAFLVRYDSEGELVWARREGGTARTQGMSIAALPDGSFLLSGTFSGEAVFGQAQDNETTIVPLGDESVFLARFSLEGDLEWVVDLGVDGGYTEIDYQQARGNLSLLRDGDVTVTANFSHGSMLAGDGYDVSPVAGSPRGLFLARYTTGGSRVWARVVPTGDGATSIFGSAELGDGTLIAAGCIQEHTVFGIGEPDGPTTLYTQSNRGVITAWTADGGFQWALLQGSVYTPDCLNRPVSFTDDLDEHDIVVTGGGFQNVATYGTNSADEQVFQTASSQDNIILLRFDREAE